MSSAAHSEPSAAGVSELMPGTLRVEGVGKCFRLAPRLVIPGVGDIDFSRDGESAGEDEEEGDEEVAAQPDIDVKEIWALRDIQFRLEPGQHLGVIGENGSGKSTLIRILAGMLTPTEGIVRGAGRVISLSRLNSPLSRELSGRENLVALARLLGITRREFLERLPEIVNFSGLGRMFEEKVKRYSSGGFARLSMSLALYCEPDILLIDDGIVGGDAPFRERCRARVRQMLDGGTSLVFSSHNLGLLSELCERGIWLREGRVAYAGPFREAQRRFERSGSGDFDNIDERDLALDDPDFAQEWLENDLQLYADEKRASLAGWSNLNKAYQEWRQRVLKRRIDLQRASSGRVAAANIVTATHGTAGAILELTLRDEAKRRETTFLPGQTIEVELIVETVEPRVEIDVRLELEAGLILAAAADLPLPFLAEAPGRYLVQTRLSGDLFANIHSDVIYKIRTRTFFTDRLDRKSQMNATMRARFRGDLCQLLEQRSAHQWSLKSRISTPNPAYLTPPEPPPPLLSRMLNTEAQRHSWHLLMREPALRIGLPWTIKRFEGEGREDSPAKPEEPAIEMSS